MSLKREKVLTKKQDYMFLCAHGCFFFSFVTEIWQTKVLAQFQYQIKVGITLTVVLERPMQSAPSLKSIANIALDRAIVCPAEHRLFWILDGGTLATSCLQFCSLLVVIAVMLWIVYAQKLPQASQYFWSVKLCCMLGQF